MSRICARSFLYAQVYQPSITPLIELEVVSVLSGMVRTQSLAIDAAMSSKLAFSQPHDSSIG
jgi:hypothetical protein